MTFRETVAGHRFVYPEKIEGSFPTIIWGKAIFDCDPPPNAHRATINLDRFSRQTKKWETRATGSSSRIPAPRAELSARATCDPHDRSAWRVRIHVTGNITAHDGRVNTFDYSDGSIEKVIRCEGNRP